MGAGGIINQREEMRNAIQPGTANYAKLLAFDDSNGTTWSGRVTDICSKNVNDWSETETMLIASMFPIVVHC
jgi:hypothetical protein